MLFSAVPLLFLLLASAEALYFTSPTSATVWSVAPGETVTWKYQAGGALIGDLQLLSADKSEIVIVATSVALQTGSLTFPSGVSLTTTTNTFYLNFVDSSNSALVYAAVGPFTIDSFSTVAVGNPKSGAGTTSVVIPHTTTTTTTKETITTTTKVSIIPTVATSPPAAVIPTTSASMQDPTTITSTADPVTIITNPSSDPSGTSTFVVTVIASSSASASVIPSLAGSSTSKSSNGVRNAAGRAGMVLALIGGIFIAVA